MRLKVFVLYLKNYRFLSYQRIAEVLADLFSIPISVSTLASIDEHCAAKVVGVAEQNKEERIRAKVVHCYETGLSINWKRY